MSDTQNTTPTPQSEESIFDKNLAALVQVNHELAIKIFALNENKKYDVYQGDDLLQINIFDKERNIALYENPLEDTLKMKTDFSPKYDRYPYFYFYGIGNGIFLKLMVGSEAAERVVVFEPELEMIYIALNFVDFSQEILSGLFIIYHTQNFEFVNALKLFDDQDSQLFIRLYELIPLNHYYSEYYADDLIEINAKLTKAIKHIMLGHGNDVIDSLMGIEHHIQNMPVMLKNPKFTELSTKKNSDYTMIVSTGPSLNKQLPILKEIQDYVNIISVDASFPILVKHGIKPDIVTVIERVPETGLFFSETTKEDQEGVIFVLVSIVHQAVLDGIRGGTKVLVMRPHGYTTYFDFKDFGYLGTGMSAANMAHELAIVMRYKKCIVIGQDLAFGEDGTSHTKGHLYTEQEESYSLMDEYVEKYGGGGQVRTTYYWKVFMDYFEKTIRLSENIMTTYNATEGGARIVGSIEKPFRELADEVLAQGVKKEKIVLEAPSKEEYEANIELMKEKVDTVLEFAEKTQKRVEKVFLRVAKEFDTLVELNKNNELEKIKYNDLVAITEEIDEIKELFNDVTFRQVFLDIIRSLLVHKELDLAALQVAPADSIDEKKEKLVDWVMQHRTWLFNFAGSIDAERVVINRAKEKWENNI